MSENRSTEETRSAKLDLPGRQEWGLKPERRSASGWAILAVLLLLVVLALEVVLVLRNPAASVGGERPPVPSADESLAGIPLKDVQVRLQRHNLPGAAAMVLEQYLATLRADQRAERRKVLKNLGDLLSKAGRYEAALVRYYEAEFLDPDPETQNQIDRQVTDCLEKLGKFDELAHELADRSQPGGKSPLSSGPGDSGPDKVVAVIGIQKITAADLNALIAEQADLQLATLRGISEEEKLSYKERILKEYQAPQRRLQALQELVARRVLYREGVEKRLDRSARVRKELAENREALIARQVVLEALEGIAVTPGDLQLFFQAEGQRYTQPAQAQARLAVLETEAAASEALATAKTEEDFSKMATERSTHASREQGGLLSAPVQEGAPFPGLGNAPELTAAVLATPAGQATARPVQVEQGFAIAFVKQTTPRRAPTFDEVRDQVTRDYAQRKEAETQQALIQQLFEKHSVTINTEAFLKLDSEGTNDQGNPGAPPDPNAPTPASPPGTGTGTD